jgi:hypothetical protein
MMNDPKEEEDTHANYRDRKLEKRSRQKLMRGNRSIYELQKAIVKRGKHDQHRNIGEET